MKNQIKKILFLLAAIYGCNSAQKQTEAYQIFRYNESKGVTTLDPAYARNLPLIWPVNQIFNGLVQFSDSLTVEPCIAKRWEISSNGLRYTFYLRSDVCFHNSKVFPDGKGRKVTASDFVYSFNRIQNPQTASPGSWVLSMLDKSFQSQGCFAPNDSVFIVQLSKPFPAFLGLMGMPYCFVVPHEAVSFYGNDFGRNPVGTGPFYLKFWKDGEKMVLRKNPHYFEVDIDGAKLPYLEAVNLTFVADKQSEFLEFIKGNIDFLSGVHAVSKDELLTRTGELNPKYREKVRMITGPYLNTEYLGILLDSAKVNGESPLLDVRVRKAIGYGIDRVSMMLYLRSNMGYPGEQGFIPPGMPGIDSKVKGFTYNPDLAKKLLVDAGYPNGKGLLPMTISTTDDYLDICEFIQHQLGELGIDVHIDVMPGAAYREMMANSKLSVFRGSWVADYADPENYLALFVSSNFSPQGPNYTHFRSKQFDNLYRQAMSKPLYQQRLPSYLAMDSTIIGNAAVIPLYYDKVVRFVSADVEGMTVNPMNLLVLKKVRKDYTINRISVK